MSIRAKALKNLYHRGKITIVGLASAIADGVITPQEYEVITGVVYTAQGE